MIRVMLLEKDYSLFKKKLLKSFFVCLFVLESVQYDMCHAVYREQQIPFWVNGVWYFLCCQQRDSNLFVCFHLFFCMCVFFFKCRILCIMLPEEHKFLLESVMYNIHCAVHNMCCAVSKGGTLFLFCCCLRINTVYFVLCCQQRTTNTF